MSRYSRDFEDTPKAPLHVRGGRGYSRYRETPRAADKLQCHICDGDGVYAGADGPVACDLCDGSGRVDAQTLEDVVLFRTRNRG